MINQTAKNALILICIVVAAFAKQPPQTNPQTRPEVFAIIDVNVVPMDRDGILEHRTVIVRGVRIAKIEPAEHIEVPAEATRIDGRRKYLMPGLADMHVHPADTDELILFVANGVTTIRNMWGFPEKHLVWREQVEKGEIVGPTLYTSGPFLDGDPPMVPGGDVVDTPDAATQAVAKHKDAGYDFIKVLSNLRSDVYDAIVAASTAHRIRVVGHVPFSVDLDHALFSGISSIEHLTGYGFALQREDSPVVDRSKKGALHRAWKHFDESKLREVVEKTRQAGVWNCPTLEAWRAYLPENMELLKERELLKYVSPSMWEWWQADLNRPEYEEVVALVRLSMDARRKVVNALNSGGARILLGTDAGSSGVLPGFSAHRELQMLVEAGLTPFEAIRAATVNAAEFLESGDEFGTVAVGQRADLLLIDGDPLSSVANTTRIAGVMLRGKWLPKAELSKLLEGVAKSYEEQAAEAEK
ncbi:MAG: amidohydrolase family protein [Planctomycetaceae bacterium]